MRYFLASLAFFTCTFFGCAHRDAAPSRALAQSGDFEARLNAAREIADVELREEAFRSIASDAARAGDDKVATRALQQMRYVDRKDECASKCALWLAKAGQSAAALEVARSIRSGPLRDEVFQALASSASG
jgi:hypothetical protein